jgi:4-aminobutyrate aminotransferase-like enzyme
MSSVAELMERRARLLGSKARLFYRNPVHIVRGEGVWLFDADGRRYLDAYNNVAHVGHCHPRVVGALAEQASRLNTHTRYLHSEILDYVERLTGTVGGDLSMAILTCTGSEANDVALRMAQAVTGKIGLVATDSTYHGNTALVSQLGTRIAPLGARAPFVRLVTSPDSYREAPGMLATRFARAVDEAIDSLEEAGFGIAALIIDPLFANEGLPAVEPGFFDEAAARVRSAGGLIIADEVQVGLGRAGSHYWGHQRVGLVPDIVTMGKPLGNGHPLAGVVTSPPVMSAFRDAFSYFNTFGGNPVSCAVGNAVLDVLQQENLIDNAAKVGGTMLEMLRSLADRHPCIGDVRGAGLFLGVEIVADRENRRPSASLAEGIVDAMRDNGILIGRAGIHNNVLKIRPPMPFSKQNANLLAETLDRVLEDLAPDGEA